METRNQHTMPSALYAYVPDAGEASLSFVQELLEHKSRTFSSRGMPQGQALEHASQELLQAVKHRLYGMDLFCFRALLTGALRALKDADGS